MAEYKKYDLVIVGSGPAGLTAAIYATRRKMKTLIISMTVGGQMAMTNDIENYPGFDSTDGVGLAAKMKEQAQKWGTEFDFNQVMSIVKNGDFFVVKTNKDDYEAKSVILAFGLTPRSLDVPGEEKLKGRGVTYCATCDGPLYRNKIVAVIGGGNSALESAEYLSKVAQKVYLINRTDQFRAVADLLERARGIENIEFYCYSNILEIKGEQKVEAIVLADVNHPEKTEEIKLDGVFIEIGYQAKAGWLKDTVELNKRGEIIVDRDGATSVEGIFAAGDCTDSQYKQIVIAAGDGAKASLQAYKYVVAKTGGVALPDWGKCELVGTDKTAKIKLS